MYEGLALPGIQRAAEPDSLVLNRTGASIQRAYNEMMDEVGARPELEALVLLHQDLELTDRSLPVRVRRLFQDPLVGLAGPLGARNVTPHLWPASRELYGTFREPTGERRFSCGSHEVEGVDGILLVLAPWVVRTLRFNEELADGFHGYDVDMSLRVRAHGGIVICDDIPYFHHRNPTEDYEAQRRAGVALARMWDPALRSREWDSAFQL
ncbi:MAG: glycosyltransferase [Solirubrobacterales bacterium]